MIIAIMADTITNYEYFSKIFKTISVFFPQVFSVVSVATNFQTS